MKQIDSRLEKVETVEINFETFKKALARNYLGERNSHDRSYVLRLYPEFTEVMKAEYYESMQGRHYDSNWDEKPFHIPPELLILEGNNGNFRDIVKYPERWEVEQNVPDITEDEIDECMQESKELYWDEMKTILPTKFNLGSVHGVGSYTVDIEWIFES